MKTNQKNLLVVAASALAFAAFLNPSNAQTNWTNTSGGDWQTPSNWSAGVPTSATNTTFADGTYTITTTGNGATAQLWVNSTNDSLTINFTGFTLTSTNFRIGQSTSNNVLNFTGGNLNAPGVIMGTGDSNNNNTFNLSGGIFTASAGLTIGAEGANNAMNVSGGAIANVTGGLSLGTTRNSVGDAENNSFTVTGTGSTANFTSSVQVSAIANGANNAVNVQNGGTFNQTGGNLLIGRQSLGAANIGNSITVNGTGSSYTFNGTGTLFEIGGTAATSGYNNRVIVSNGGSFTTSGTAKTLTIYQGANAAGNNRLVIDNGTMSHTGTISNSQDIKVLNGGNLTVSGLVTNVASSNGTIEISGATSIATFNGGLTLNGGASAVTGNGTLALGGTLTNASGNSVVAPNINLLGGTRTVTVNGIAMSLNGAISNGGITKDGSAVLLLTNNSNNFDGAITVNAGALRANAANALGSTVGGTVVSSGAQLQLDAATNTTYAAEDLTLNGNGGGSGALLVLSSKSFTWTGGINLASNSTINDAGGVLNVQGSITGSGQLTKSGIGRLALSGNSSYSGGTLVTAGSLILSNTSGSATGSGAVTIQSGARIGGNGTIGGDLTLNSGAQFVFTLGNTLNVTGTVTLDNSFGIASLTTVTGAAIDWSLVSNGVYTLINNSSDFSNISNFGLSNAADIGGGRSAYFQNGSLELVVIPEPGTWSLLAGGLAAIALYRRRRSCRTN